MYGYTFEVYSIYIRTSSCLHLAIIYFNAKLITSHSDKLLKKKQTNKNQTHLHMTRYKKQIRLPH